MKPPLISACVISYNQEEFISETIQSVINQNLSCDYEIVVGDDCSTDQTPLIIAEFAESDDRIRVLANDGNLGMHRNWARTIAACRGKYIAICEGDDVWLDMKKLQHQVDILEKNPNVSACFSNATIIDSKGIKAEYPYVDQPYNIVDAEQFMKLHFNPIPTCTIVFRSTLFNGFPSAYYQSPFADWILHAILIQQGDYFYFPEITSAYRQHEGGVWTGLEEEKQLLNKLVALKTIKLLVRETLQSSVNEATKKHLDKLLYYYRNQKNWIGYYSTWFKLKTL
jgi:glycosyltransferase involved in cell wall biosynthesis